MNGKNLSFNKEKLLENYGNPDFAMAYGSGVFLHSGVNKGEKMIDFVFGVNNTKEWHKKNLETNRSDYSNIVKICGSNLVNALQPLGAKIYYNPYVDFQGNSIKYGIIDTVDLIDDLEDRNNIFVAGRLHKPVEVLSTTDVIQNAMIVNFNHAIKTSLLLLPENFSKEELFTTITGLSYTGDIRGKHEDSQKITNIVKNSFDEFIKLYNPILREYEKNNIIISLNNDKIQQTKDPKEVSNIYNKLPKNLLNNIELENPNINLEESIYNAIRNIIHRSSSAQLAKGIISSGLRKSWKYATSKIKKGQKK